MWYCYLAPTIDCILDIIPCNKSMWNKARSCWPQKGKGVTICPLLTLLAGHRLRMPFLKETASRMPSRSWATPCGGRKARTWSVQECKAKHSAARPGLDRGCAEHTQPFRWYQDCWLRPSAEHTGEPSIQPKPGDQQLGYGSYCLCLFALPFYSLT